METSVRFQIHSLKENLSGTKSVLESRMPQYLIQQKCDNFLNARMKTFYQHRRQDSRNRLSTSTHVCFFCYRYETNKDQQ